MVKPLHQDSFLGEWSVREYIYSAQAELLGVVQQQRHLYRGNTDGELKIDQFCEPSLELAKHPMGAFAGEFSFNLIKHGIQRHYLGPDVQGFAYSLGDIFLCGEGIWPRFGYNFRSWSVKISETIQLTGGVFYRGFNVIGVIFGVATLGKDLVQASALSLNNQIQGGQGQVVSLQLSTEVESTQALTRQLKSAGHWVESSKGSEASFSLAACDFGYLIERTSQGNDRFTGVGMAVAYGPCLFWETHGPAAHSTLGLEISDPFSSRMFAIRRYFKGGCLLSLEAQQISA